MNFQKQDFDLIFKILLVGDKGVGKKAFFSRYIDDIFEEGPNELMVSKIKRSDKLQFIKNKISIFHKFFFLIKFFFPN
jgi:GTPase SAR1 family protein